MTELIQQPRFAEEDDSSQGHCFSWYWTLFDCCPSSSVFKLVAGIAVQVHPHTSQRALTGAGLAWGLLGVAMVALRPLAREARAVP